MDIKDKLNLAWKFLFLAVFTYGVISVTCCSSSCAKSSCTTAKSCSKAPITKTCDASCVKPCCAK